MNTCGAIRLRLTGFHPPRRHVAARSMVVVYDGEGPAWSLSWASAGNSAFASHKIGARMWTTNTDPFLKLLDLLLLVPLSISVIYAACHRYWRGTWKIRKAIILGFSLPLALIYTVMLWVPPKPYLPFMDNFSYQISLIVIAAPQSLILYPIGFFAWAHLFRQSQRNWLANLGVVIVVAVAIIGHIWTRTFLAGL